MISILHHAKNAWTHITISSSLESCVHQAQVAYAYITSSLSLGSSVHQIQVAQTHIITSASLGSRVYQTQMAQIHITSLHLWEVVYTKHMWLPYHHLIIFGKQCTPNPHGSHITTSSSLENSVHPGGLDPLYYLIIFGKQCTPNPCGLDPYYHLIIYGKQCTPNPCGSHITTSSSLENSVHPGGLDPSYHFSPLGSSVHQTHVAQTLITILHLW